VFSLVIPVYKNEESLPDLLATLTDLDREMKDNLDVVFVIDGSPDDCAGILYRELSRAPFDSQVIVLSRNFGVFPAVRAGLAHAQVDIVAVMAAEQQEPPELPLEIQRRLRSGEWDVVVAKLSGGVKVPGYAATVLAVVFFGGLNLFGLGVLDEYLWRAFENTKRHPLYVIANRCNYCPGENGQGLALGRHGMRRSRVFTGLV